jgi:hypothetical protein
MKGFTLLALLFLFSFSTRCLSNGGKRCHVHGLQQVIDRTGSFENGVGDTACRRRTAEHSMHSCAQLRCVLHTRWSTTGSAQRCCVALTW